MQRSHPIAFGALLVLGLAAATASDWRQFRGPDGLGVSAEKSLPITWSAEKNIAWK